MPAPIAGYVDWSVTPRFCYPSNRFTAARDPALSAQPAFLTHLTAEARDKPATTSLRLLAVLNVLLKYAGSLQGLGAKRRAPCTDGLLTRFASPRGEKCRLESKPQGKTHRPHCGCSPSQARYPPKIETHVLLGLLYT